MNKSITIPSLMLLVALLMTADALAQRGRGRQANQQRGSSQAGRQQGQGQNGQGEIGGNGSQRGNQQNGKSALTANEKQGLILMREEEKLARDVYTALNAQWGEDIFTNIARAESQHMNAVGNLLTRYNVPDPIKNDAAGVFTSRQFQQLYTTLVNAGSTSRIDALRVGLKIEEMDIADLRVAINATNNQDIQRVLGNLLRGSRNHLRAFASQLNASGGTYVATSLSQTDFNQIATSSQETGRENGKSNGRGNRQAGNGQGQTMGKSSSSGQGTQQRRGSNAGNSKGKGQGNRR